MELLNEPPIEAIMMILNTTPDEIARKSSERVQFFQIHILPYPTLWTKEHIRYILDEYLNCFWYYKEQRIGISETMLKLGKYLVSKSSCTLKYDGEYYYSDCPNILLHYDFGFSLRGKEQYRCSICGKDIIECDHITNYIYDNVTCININEKCNICLKDFNKCNHVENENYDNVKAIKMITLLELITFDLVKEPEMIFTRMMKKKFSKKEIIDGLKKDNYSNEFNYGISTLNCNHCNFCNGYNPKRTQLIFNKSY